MSEKQKQAQQERRAREKEQTAQAAAEAAEAVAASIPDDTPGDPKGEEPDAPRPKADHSARMEMLESLRNKPEDMDEYIRAETEDEPAAEVETPSDATVEAAPEATPAPEMVTVKIDGEEQQVLKSEVDEVGGIKSYQMLKASEKRYEQAAKEKQELHQLLLQTKVLLESQQKPKEPEKTPDELIKERVTQIQLGTPEEAAQAIKEILQATTPKQIDPVAFANQVANQVAMQTEAQAFAARNSDLLSNQYFAQLAVLMEHDKLAKSRPSDWKAFYTNLEVEFRNALGRPATTQVPSVATQQTGQPTSGSVADKEARKASIVNLPVAGARVPAKEEQKPLSREDRLNLLRKARGQPVG